MTTGVFKGVRVETNTWGGVTLHFTEDLIIWISVGGEYVVQFKTEVAGRFDSLWEAVFEVQNLQNIFYGDTPTSPPLEP